MELDIVKKSNTNNVKTIDKRYFKYLIQDFLIFKYN